MKTKNDNRMAWIRNIDILSQSSGDTYYYEYEVASECHIPGVLDYDGGKMLCGGCSIEKDKNGLYHYLLRIQHQVSDGNYYNENADKKGYYFKDGIIGELLSLFSLYFQCRFYIVATYHGELTSHGLKMKFDHDFLYKPSNRAVHPKIFTDGARNFARGLSEFLNSVKKLEAEQHQSFILACYHYARSLKEVGIDSEMVFIRLVSTVEAISRALILDKKYDLFRGKDLDEFIKDGALTKKEKAELKQIFEVRKSRAKFICFIEKFCKGSFQGGNWKAKHLKIKRADLSKVLGAIYDARSRYLHVGAPMYLSEFMCGSDKWDTDLSFGMTIDNRKFLRLQKLPYTYWFENVVRHSLLNYLRDSIR